MSATTTRQQAFAAINEWYAQALESVEPRSATAGMLAMDGNFVRVGDRTYPRRGRLLVVGAGKAAAGMAVGVEDALGAIVSGGLVVTKDGHTREDGPRTVDVVEAAHPVPDERGLAAGARMLDIVAGGRPDDLVIAVISGGGSALLESLRPPLKLDDLQRLTDAMLRAGAPIGDLNAVRSPLSRMKSGGLLAASRAPIVSLVLSDVIGNDPHVIASGPTVPGSPLRERAARALAMLDRYNVIQRAPSRVTALLRELAGQQLDSSDTSTSERHTEPLLFVGDNARAVRAAIDAAQGMGLNVDTPAAWQAREGEASDLGREWVAACLACDRRIDVLIGGGEATVSVRGDGVGGRNTEFALAAGLALDAAGNDDWMVASLATDGQDAMTGAAGAIVDRERIVTAREIGVDPDAALNTNDSRAVFAVVGGLIEPGPTGTNVNDLYFAVRRSSFDVRG